MTFLTVPPPEPSWVLSGWMAGFALVGAVAAAGWGLWVRHIDRSRR